MFNKKTLIGALVSLTALSATAEESKLSYTYVGISYDMSEVIDEDFGGFSFNGSAALNDAIYVTGTYSALTSDQKVAGEDVDVTQFNFGVGFHTPLNSNVDFYTDLSYLKVDLEAGGFSSDGNGYLLNAGLRGKPTEKIELGAALNYADVEDENETGYLLSGRYFLDPKVSLGLGYGSTNDIDTISFNARLDL